MRWTQQLRMKILMLFGRRHAAARLDQELAFHLEQQIAENVAVGMGPSEARSAALRLFGNPTLLREEAQSSWSWNGLAKTWRDIRYAARTLRRSPGFAALAVAVMALGIGATTSLFTIVRSVLLAPLPFAEPNKLVMVYEHFRNTLPSLNGYNVVAPGDFYDWREKTNGFQDMAAWRWWGCNLAGEHVEMPEVVTAAAGSWNLLSVLGIQPAYGRAFTPDEDRPGARKVVLISWSLFQRRFGGNVSIVGQQIHLDANPYTVIGVLPKAFTYPNPTVQLWVPYAASFPIDEAPPHDMHQSYVVARLKAGVTAQAATQQVSTLQYQIHMANQGRPVAEEAISRPMIEDVVRDIKTPLLVLMAAVGCMLLIACLNLSNLLVARSSARRKEVAIRGALGGGRLTLIREQMMESLLICLIGGTLGLSLAYSATHWLATHWRDLPRADAIHLDATVLGFSIAMVLVAALVAGLVPAISATGTALITALQDSSRAIGGSASRAGLRKALLTAEIALTVVLLVSAGLLFKSFLQLRTADLGCLTDNVLTLKYGLPEMQYNKPEMVVAFHESLLQRVRTMPGVIAAGLVSTPPGGGYEGDQVFIIPEHPAQNHSMLDQDALYRTADPGYFKALQIPLLSGRYFTEQERLDRAHFIVINKKMADQYFPGESPLGKHLTWQWQMKPENFEIIGVVGNTLHEVGATINPTAYFPIFIGTPRRAGSATLVVHASGDPLTLSIPIQKQIAALDPALPVYDVLTFPQIVGQSTVSESFSATLVLAFAVLSLLLAAVGLYGVLSYLVSQRMTEFGIRMALGAQRGELLRLVLTDGLKPVAVGLALGSAGGIAAGMLIKSLLYGTRPVDPAVFGVMIGSLMLTALFASMAPALRACRIEPTQALRME
ncbi:MAG TPA: ABC transporter permease [Candidatus Angelobacter sp.]|nr:ABC transporter permease [Candidatus Angelobacter sp.]